MKQYFMDNPFYRDDKKEKITAILVTEFENGKKENKQLQFDKFMSNGEIEPLYEKIMNEIGDEKITKNTEERKIKKEKERLEQTSQKEQKEKAKNLETLFDMKLKAFEIPEVKECTDRKLRSRLRSSKNEYEMIAYISIIMQKSMEEKSAD